MLCHVSHWSLQELDSLDVEELNFWTASALKLWTKLYTTEEKNNG